MEFAGEMFLAGTKDEKWARDLLSHLDDSSLFALSKTASDGKIAAVSVEEAINVIIFTTSSLDKLLSYQKVYKQLLLEYLYKCKAPIEGKTKEKLITSAKNYWAQKDSEVGTSPQSDPQLKPTVVFSDIFASQFSSWFYGMLNNMANECEDTEEILSPSVFCSNCSLRIFFIMENGSSDIHSQGADQCYSVLKEIQREKRLSFSPDMLGGTLALKSEHGMIKVLCQGTLHMEHSFVGIFEEEFGLVFDPGHRKWKISFCNVNLKHTTSSSMQALPKQEIFEIQY
ncbi:uncharacterized protein C3orf38 homolog isoform X2 [Oratosquilla oratoria]|uniref:uncharacterized protein C3orf38 homolog isoform X2 n=1 Tax=Oratosquilla oratoria TaxID=337810 RepID=UPI003F76ABB9